MRDCAWRRSELWWPCCGHQIPWACAGRKLAFHARFLRLRQETFALHSAAFRQVSESFVVDDIGFVIALFTSTIFEGTRAHCTGLENVGK